MLSNPRAGWCDFELGDLKVQASYMTDIPFDWLRACLNGLKYVIPASFYLDEEGSECLITSDWDVTYIIRRHSGKTELIQPNVSLRQFAEMLLADIRKDFESWVCWCSFQLSEEQYARRKAMLTELLAETEKQLETYMTHDIQNY